MGGNYVVKAQPYYPPKEVVQKDAKMMVDSAAKMAYRPPPAADGTPRPVVPCVRLGAMMEAALPEKGKPIDPDFMSKLEATVKAFQEEGEKENFTNPDCFDKFDGELCVMGVWGRCLLVFFCV